MSWRQAYMKMKATYCNWQPKKMGILPEQIQRWGILRKSLDARKKNDILYKYSLWIQPEENLIPRLEKKDLKPMKP